MSELFDFVFPKYVSALGVLTRLRQETRSKKPVAGAEGLRLVSFTFFVFLAKKIVQRFCTSVF